MKNWPVEPNLRVLSEGGAGGFGEARGASCEAYKEEWKREFGRCFVGVARQPAGEWAHGCRDRGKEAKGALSPRVNMLGSLCVLRQSMLRQMERQGRAWWPHWSK